MQQSYDVIIVGAGPAGIFAALKLVEDTKLKVLLVEKGPGIKGRICPSAEKKITCIRCEPCRVVSGWGGAGALSDGKLTLSADVGGNLEDYIGRNRLEDLIQEVDAIYRRFGAPEELHGTDQEKIAELARQATLAELRLVNSKVRHLGTGRTINILEAMFEYLKDKMDIALNTEVARLIVKDGKALGVELSDGVIIEGKYIVVAPGRAGAEWLAKEAADLKLSLAVNPVDIGVRVELPAAVMEKVTDVVWEAKLIYHSATFDDKVRTFCMCPYGEVVTENNDDLITVNGHSHAEKRTENTNFALLVSKNFTEPFKEPITYGRYIAGLANLLGGGVIVQRLGDLLDGHRSTKDRLKKGLVRPTLQDATPGDLSLVFPYRHLVNLLEMLKALDKLAPGVYSRHTLLYGVEVKFYSSRLNLNNQLETQVQNLFAVGDGAGVTRGLIQASASGMIVAQAIEARSGKNSY
ncbi:MAG: NAD(P)/FAD-dependent oxidoreductase [Firmicutes bacterium]|nr:NAD(P)/FAD-dependent oxidoreductase [Bacillota bacterium]